MLQRFFRLAASFAVLGLLISSANGQQEDDYRRFFKKPETAPEFWFALQFEIEVGKYELANSLLKGFLEKLPMGDEGDQLLLQIEERKPPFENKGGMSSFLKLLTIPDSLKLTEQSLKALQADGVPKDGKPKDFLDRVKILQDKSFITEGQFLEALRLVLSFEEVEKYKDQLLKHSSLVSMRKDAGPLVERVSLVVQKYLSNPERIKRFSKGLQGSPEERSYAIAELRRSGALAVPYLVETLRERSEADIHAAILSALVRLNKDVLPPLLAALDVDDANLRAELIDVLKNRGEAAAIPALWYYAASPRQPDFVRQKATAALALLHGKEAEKLPSSKAALTREANRYYRHEVRFPDPQGVTVWQSDGKQLLVPPAVYTVSQAEEYYGLRYARQALDLDPAYQPAQVVFLSLALDKAYERAGLDGDKAAVATRDLLRVNPDLITAVLEQALSEQRLTVVLGTVRALGELTEIRAARARVQQAPVLVRALNFPERRVQLAAVEALLRIPGPPAPLAGTRTVQILRRALSASVVPKVLLADADADRANEIKKSLRQAGFEADVVRNGRDLMRRLAEASDIDLVLMDQALPDPGLSHLLPQLRADADSGWVPLFITLSAAEPPRKSPAQTALALEANEKLIQIIFKKEFENTKTDPEQLPGLAALLIDKGKEKKPDADAMIAYWREARKLAGKIAEEDRAAGTKLYEELVDASLAAARDAVTAADIEAADRLLLEAAATADISKVQPLKDNVQARVRELGPLLKAIERKRQDLDARALSLRRLAAPYRNTWVMPTTFAPEALKGILLGGIVQAQGWPLSEEERKQHVLQAMDGLKRMAVGELPGYDAAPAEKAIRRALRSDELAAQAMEAAGALPGQALQHELAALLLDKARKPELRAAAAFQLNRHIQQRGLVLSREQIRGIEELFQASDDPRLKKNVALVIGSMRPGPVRTGARLQQYFPPPPAPPAGKEPEKEKEKDKAKEK